MRFVFVSSNLTWGGSEELWSATAIALAERGHQVVVYKMRADDEEPRIRRLRELSVPIRDLGHFPILSRLIYTSVERLSWSLSNAHRMARLWTGLKASPRPDLVVVSQGGNFDGDLLAEVCRRLQLPYALISQKASDLYWPADVRVPRVRRMYAEARAAFFVSQHNLRLTEQQLGCELPHARVVRNPFLVPWEPRNDWPDDGAGLRLACIGRMYPMEKGQDLLLRVLARERWRARPLSVTFYGDGPQRQSLERMASFLGLTNTHFAGYVRDIATVWDDHHGLILASRCEGLPLVLVEAMLSGRVAIVTDVGGTAEVADDGVTSFVAPAATEDALDATMERAWARRREWRRIGAAAADRIRTLVPRAPEQELATILEELAGARPDR
jgi:glycosyltransferase involved in cell wall biosynthesis